MSELYSDWLYFKTPFQKGGRGDFLPSHTPSNQNIFMTTNYKHYIPANLNQVRLDDNGKLTAPLQAFYFPKA